MNNYIEREEAEKIFVEYNCVKYHVTEMGDTNEANRVILMFRENAKSLFSFAHSADVAPVGHGHWIKIDPAGIYECSECGKNVMTNDIEAYEYCHGCGAKMDGEDNG